MSIFFRFGAETTLNFLGLMDISKGWLTSARRVPSPNFNARPDSVVVDAIIVHGISLPPKQYGGDYIEAFFQNRLDFEAHPYFHSIKDLQVSSHILIKRTGECVQFVSFDDRAWHAGESELKGRQHCNDFAVGIELEGCDDVSYEDAQYLQLAAVTRALMLSYNDITLDRIVGHSDISPGRKTDPGPAFDWGYFRSLLEKK